MSLPRSVAAVIVTRNRKALLIECLYAVLGQSYLVDHIYVVDNGSTDGTHEALAACGLLADGRVEIVSVNYNSGGAGGFSLGLQLAVKQGHDWVWLMDDDSLPRKDALAELCRPLGFIEQRIGFVCSHVVWRDGLPHRMNLPGISLLSNEMAFSRFIDINVLVVPSCSFVSTLVSSSAVAQCGLPLREMFIWGDDVEFFRRLSFSGFIGLYAWKSVVTHNTKYNVNDDLVSADASDFYKFYFGIRNNLFIIRRFRGLLPYIFALLKNIFLMNLRLLLRRRSHKLDAVRLNTLASLASIFFKPTIEFPRM